MRVRPDVEALALELHEIGASADPPKLYPILEKALDAAYGVGVVDTDILWRGGRPNSQQFHDHHEWAAIARAAASIQDHAPALPQGDGAGGVKKDP